mmetsp:Transcript_87985/g.228249  ORF Transcript_87985/g.228249 Transcript_87985/m.228249 type:complete len:208 (-) Transcript_87985:390-1013(-)
MVRTPTTWSTVAQWPPSPEAPGCRCGTEPYRTARRPWVQHPSTRFAHHHLRHQGCWTARANGSAAWRRHPRSWRLPTVPAATAGSRAGPLARCQVQAGAAAPQSQAASRAASRAAGKPAAHCTTPPWAQARIPGSSMACLAAIFCFLHSSRVGSSTADKPNPPHLSTARSLEQQWPPLKPGSSNRGLRRSTRQRPVRPSIPGCTEER